MKKIFILFIALILNCNVVFASENFLNSDWWKTATVEDVKAEIARGADVNAKDAFSQNALMKAVHNNDNYEITKTLIEAGADVNAKDEYDRNALIDAADYNKNPELIRALIDAGADINAKDKYGRTALMLSKSKHYDGIADILVSKGASLDEKEFYTYVFLKAIWMGNDGKWYSWWNNASLDDIQKAISIGVDINIKDESANSVLMKASEHVKNPELIRALIDAGADVNAKDNDGLTPLLHAISKNENPKIIKALIDAGANVNITMEKWQYEGATALIYAADRLENPEIIKVLIENGADVNAKAKNTEGQTALMYAAKNNDNPEIIKVLIENEADVNAKDSFGKTAMMIAAGNNENPEIIKALIEGKANIEDKDKYGWKALMYASLNKNSEIAKLLIGAGADVMAKIETGEEAGMMALDIAQKENGNAEVIEILKRYRDVFNEFDEIFADCYSTQNIGSYANKFCECAIKTAINALNEEDTNKAQDAFDNARVGTFKNLIQKGKSAAFKECY